ncbi:hypothetical protein CsSME_00024984 [Camellia sinensis var. sinensis]
MSGGRDAPRRRILFLGGRSFELEEEGEDPIGRRRLAIDRLFSAVMRLVGVVRNFAGPSGNLVVWLIWAD